jgi:hypothetical protein
MSEILWNHISVGANTDYKSQIIHVYIRLLTFINNFYNKVVNLQHNTKNIVYGSQIMSHFHHRELYFTININKNY